jgi:Phytanoyl-CoA dioxygenase (PhyH)
LNEFTEENGATLVIPGSHRWDPDRAPTYDERVPAVMPVLLYLGDTYHFAGECVRKLPYHIQAILGYSAIDGLTIGGGVLGVYDSQDPLELINSGKL